MGLYCGEQVGCSPQDNISCGEHVPTRYTSISHGYNVYIVDNKYCIRSCGEQCIYCGEQYYISWETYLVGHIHCGEHRIYRGGHILWGTYLVGVSVILWVPRLYSGYR